MNILLVAATPFEIAPTLRFLEEKFECSEEQVFSNKSLKINLLITGVGIPATVWALANALVAERPDWVLNAGVAGAFDTNQFPLGTVVNVVTERWGDLGAEDADGSLLDLFDLGLAERDATPYIYGVLHNPADAAAAFLPKAHGLTMQQVHGSAEAIRRVREKYPQVQVESMEGAAVFFACLQAGVPFAEVRAISNLVERRNRENWDLPLAIKQLNEVLVEMLGAF